MKKIVLGAMALVLVSLTSCSDDDDSSSVLPDGGTLTGGPYTFVEGDGKVDNVSSVSLTANTGDSGTYVITDEVGVILGLPGDLETLEKIDFDGQGAGVCLIRYLSFNGVLDGLVAGQNISEVSGVLDWSNTLTVNRVSDAEITLNLLGLEDLGEDFVYEGWIIVDGSPVTTGIFTVDASGALSQEVFSVNGRSLVDATAFVLSIEPTIDPDPDPAATKLLTGAFSGDAANVSSNGIVTPIDFTDSWGNYIIATPTDADNTNELSGIWFIDNSDAPTLVAGLRLPELNPGWQYEGWVVFDGGPVSTGTFLDPMMADDNATMPSFRDVSITGNGPGYPGEDFLMGSAAGVNFPTDLSGKTVVISVEPLPDNSPAPFALKPLAGMIPTDVTTGSLQTLTPGSGPLASLSGTVTR